jgi:hypothetical protein
VDCEVELMMIDRQLLGDVALAALLAVSTTAVARPQSAARDQTSTRWAPAAKSVIALASAGDRQVGLYR